MRPFPRALGLRVRAFVRALLALAALALLLTGTLALAAPPARAPTSRPAAPRARAPRLDLAITIFSWQPGADMVGVAYARDVPDEEIRRDFANLAEGLGQASSKVEITRKDGVTTAGETFHGISNWKDGTQNLDPLVDAFRRFGRLRILWAFGPGYPPQKPSSLDTPPLRIDKQVMPGGMLDYHVTIDESGGVPAHLPSTDPVRGMRERLVVALIACGLVTAVAVFLIVGIVVRNRRPARPRGKS